MSNPNTRKSCVVPKCTNTTTNAPEKLFFHVPMDPKMRKKWLKTMNRLDPFGDKSTVYCCEDHFDIESDMDNYIKYKLVGGRIQLKKGTVPHKFECQQEKKDKIKRTAVLKRDKINYFEKLLIKDEASILDEAEKNEEIFVACDPLSFENSDWCLETSQQKQCLETSQQKQCLEILQQKQYQNKGVQVNLKEKCVHKSTMTDGKYYKKKRKKTSLDSVSACNSVL